MIIIGIIILALIGYFISVMICGWTYASCRSSSPSLNNNSQNKFLLFEKSKSIQIENDMDINKIINTKNNKETSFTSNLNQVKEN